MPDGVAADSTDATREASASFRVSRGAESLLPAASVSIIIDDEIAGTNVNATISFEFMDLGESYGIGYEQQFIQVTNGGDAVPVGGISYGQRREYSFAYLGAEKLFDHLIEEEPDCITNNPDYPDIAWDIHSKESQYVGPIWIDNMSQLSHAGYVLQYDDMTLCFENDEFLVLGPAVMTIGVNFTHFDAEWSAQLIFDVSESAGIIRDAWTIAVDLTGGVPVDPNWMGTSHSGEVEMMGVVTPVVGLAGVVVIAAVAVQYRRRSGV
ncbi:MAG: hypothetical protein ACFFFC_19415 [Candidatus Thorarchaeota archaeon]